MMKKGTIGIVLLLFGATFLAPAPAAALNLPPLNLGLTDILDGAVPGPGTYYTLYVQPYNASSIKNADGDSNPAFGDVANTLAMNQVVHVYKHKLLGAHLGADLLVPFVTIAADAPLNTNPGWLGDVTAGPFLQWFDTKLLGRPFFHRFELDISIPTGQYDSKYALNPGSNIWVIEPYYSFTWFLSPKFSTSWRLHYTYSTENDAPFVGSGADKLKPGQAFHFNYSFEYEVVKNVRAAVAGYYLTQITEDEVNGTDVPDSEEQVFAVGPALHWIVSDHYSMGLKTAWETGAENRPEGNRTTLRFTYKF